MKKKTTKFGVPYIPVVLCKHIELNKAIFMINFQYFHVGE